MNSFFFYFSIEDKDKMLQYLQFIYKNFAEIFNSEYEWFDYLDNEDLLKTKRIDCDEIWGVHSKAELSPYTNIKIWDDCFSISVEMGYLFLEKINLWNNESELRNKAKFFSDRILNELPLLAMDFWEWDEPFENWWKALLDEKVSEWIIFWYVREKNEFRFIEWKI